jgi:REP element-mobilizing transposase RayT
MPFDPDKHHRRSVRLKEYDYTQSGAYFVTVCKYQRDGLFGEVINERMQVNAYGEIAYREWVQTAALRPHVELDAFVVMPNHIHAIVVITQTPASDAPNTEITPNPPINAHTVGARRAVPPIPSPARQFGTSIPGSLSTIIGAYKSAVTKEVNRLRNTPGAAVWQRNFYERVIRNEQMLNAIRTYIEANPSTWAQDTENMPFLHR